MNTSSGYKMYRAHSSGTGWLKNGSLHEGMQLLSLQAQLMVIWTIESNCNVYMAAMIVGQIPDEITIVRSQTNVQYESSYSQLCCCSLFIRLEIVFKAEAFQKMPLSEDAPFRRCPYHKMPPSDDAPFERRPFQKRPFQKMPDVCSAAKRAAVVEASRRPFSARPSITRTKRRGPTTQPLTQQSLSAARTTTSRSTS